MSGGGSGRRSRQVWQVRMLRSKLDVAGCRNKIVSRGRRHATSDVSAISEAAVRPVSLICGAGRDRTSSRARLLHAGGWAPTRTNSFNDFAGVAAQRCDPKRQPGVSRDDSAMACRAICSPPKAGQACAQCDIANLCGGTIGRASSVAPGGAPVPGPAVCWKGRRHGPRKHRRWANAWSPSRLLAACRSTSRTMRPCASATKPSIKRCSFKVVARCAAS